MQLARGAKRSLAEGRFRALGVETPAPASVQIEEGKEGKVGNQVPTIGMKKKVDTKPYRW